MTTEYSRFLSPLLCTVVLIWSGATLSAEPESASALKQYLASVSERRWADALPPAARLVELARMEYGTRSVLLSSAMTRLGGVQFALKDYASAEAAFVEALTILEHERGQMDPAFEEPMRGLGYTLAATDRHAEAVPVLERALLASQRHNGLFDLSQMGLRQQLANSLSELGRGPEAEAQFRSILQTAKQAYGNDDIRLVEILDIIGDWYARWGYFQPARGLYREAIELVETKASATDARLIKPLRSLGHSYLRELLFINAGQLVYRSGGPRRRDRLPSEGEEAFLRALSVMETSKMKDPAVYGSALVDTGDWFLLKRDTDRAFGYYRSALTEPAALTVDTAQSGEPLSYPFQLDFEYPSAARRFLDRSPDSIVDKHVVIEFTVTRTGTVTDARVVESDATDRMERETLASIREALYRPRFENGEAVDTTNVRYQQKFRELKE